MAKNKIIFPKSILIFFKYSVFFSFFYNKDRINVNYGKIILYPTFTMKRRVSIDLTKKDPLPKSKRCKSSHRSSPLSSTIVIKIPKHMTLPPFLPREIMVEITKYCIYPIHMFIREFIKLEKSLNYKNDDMVRRRPETMIKTMKFLEMDIISTIRNFNSTSKLFRAYIPCVSDILFKNKIPETTECNNDHLRREEDARRYDYYYDHRIIKKDFFTHYDSYFDITKIKDV